MKYHILRHYQLKQPFNFQMSSRKLKHSSFYVPLINYVLCNKVVLDYKFVYFVYY